MRQRPYYRPVLSVRARIGIGYPGPYVRRRCFSSHTSTSTAARRLPLIVPRMRCWSCVLERRSVPLAHVDELPGDRRRRRHRRRHQMRAALEALAALEVAVRGRGAALARLRACPGSSPGTSSSPARAIRSPRPWKILCSPSASACSFTRPEPGTIMALTLALTVLPSAMRATSRKSSMRELVHEPMNTRSMRDVGDLLAALEPHVLQRALGGAALVLVGDLGRHRHAAGDRGDLLGARAPGHDRRQLGGVEPDLAVEDARRRRSAASPSSARASSHSLPFGALGRPLT